MLYIGIGRVDKLKGILGIVDDVVLVGGILLNIVFAERNLCAELYIAVFVAVDDLNQTVLRNLLAVGCGNILVGKQRKGYVRDLVLIADTDQIVLFQYLL